MGYLVQEELWRQKESINIYIRQKFSGGGSYYGEQFSIKLGRWIELSDQFNSISQVTYIGDYINGKRVGRWDIFFQQVYGDRTNKLAGGGSYDEEKEPVKVGKWIELSDNFDEYSQVTHQGEYKNSKKIGRWDIWFKKYFGDKNNELIAGGQYSEEQCLIKVGHWIEINDIFTSRYQVTYIGQYKNGKKAGLWQLKCKIYDEEVENYQIFYF